ncbi:MAG: hypothetical protein M1401_03385 [Chloroflexi bacterium]|nr:hypothetical protein [Chloroflexota bacterium]MCL5107910.1 hypothetical protein [Chloroflexota bacterium]
MKRWQRVAIALGVAAVCAVGLAWASGSGDVGLVALAALAIVSASATTVAQTLLP